MKNVLFATLQFVLFFGAFFVGSFLPPFHMEHVVSVTPDGTRVFIMDGLVIMIVLFVIILLIEAVRKRIRIAGVWTTIAFVLAALAGFAAKLGFLTR
jgi:hypothetical protein